MTKIRVAVRINAGQEGSFEETLKKLNVPEDVIKEKVRHALNREGDGAFLFVETQIEADDLRSGLTKSGFEVVDNPQTPNEPISQNEIDALLKAIPATSENGELTRAFAEAVILRLEEVARLAAENVVKATPPVVQEETEEEPEDKNFRVVINSVGDDEDVVFNIVKLIRKKTTGKKLSEIESMIETLPVEVLVTEKGDEAYDFSNELRNFGAETTVEEPDQGGATIEDIYGKMLTLEDLDYFPRKDDLKNLVAKDDIKDLVKKEDLKEFAKKEDVDNMEISFELPILYKILIWVAASGIVVELAIRLMSFIVK